MTIDKKHFKLTCSECGVEEMNTILDRGNGWAGSDWNSTPVKGYQSFEVTFDGGGKAEPEVLSAVCTTCGGMVKAEISYSQ